MKHIFSLLAASGIMLLSQTAFAWEMRVCAQPANPPVSSEDGTGFENRIAAVLADELGADLTFEWMVLNRTTVAYEMNAGACDVAMGVADGAGGLISTIAYYQTPYVWVFPVDGPALTGALDDEQLTGLRLATYPNGLTDNAVRGYGWGDQLVHVEPEPRNLAHDYTEPMLNAVLNGEVDAALVEGPRAGNFVLNHPELALQPVSPLIVEPLMQLYRNATIATRASDDSLRDQLNIALAARWDEVQGILAEYGVPTMPSPPPVLPRLQAAESFIGLLLPTPAMPATEYDGAVREARAGAHYGDGAFNAENVAIRMIQASTPSVESAVRAAERLIEVDGVSVLIGGLGTGQAEAIAEVANANGIPFISLDPLAEPGEFGFHVGASLATKARGLLGHVGARDWFVVSGPVGAEVLADAIATSGGSLMDSHTVETSTLIYYDLLAEIGDSGANAVLLNLPNAEQEQFIAQAAMLLGDQVEVYGVTDIVGQTRDFLLRWRTVGSLTPRIALWEPNYRTSTVLSLNFAGRNGRALDPAAWAGYAASQIAHQLIDSRPDDLTKALAEGMEFSVGKPNPVSFDPDTHELLQDLFIVQIDPEMEWSIALASQNGFAQGVEVVPAGE